MARRQARGGDGGGEGAQLLALLGIAFAVNIPLLALVMLFTGTAEPGRALILSGVGLAAGAAVFTALRWMRKRRSTARR